MFTPSVRVTYSYRDRGSRFIGFLVPAPSIAAFERQLETVRSDHPGASHHCYAYRITPEEIQEFDQDDGEPGGTAGKPILNQLRSANLINAGLIVVRYFGGTKLGTSGLIQAYGKTAGQCIHHASLLEVRLTRNFRITYPYPEENLIEKLKSRWKLTEIEATYREKVTLTVGCVPEWADQFQAELKQQSAWRPIEFSSLGADFVTLKSKT